MHIADKETRSAKQEKQVKEGSNMSVPVTTDGYDLQKLLDDCERPVAEIHEMHPDYRERIFYTLLMKGEKLMKMGITKIDDDLIDMPV